MLDGVVAEARGDRMQTLPVAPEGPFWLGRLAPEIVVQNSRSASAANASNPARSASASVPPLSMDDPWVLRALGGMG